MKTADLNSVIDRMAAIKQTQEALKAEYEQLQAWLLTDAEAKLTDTKRKSVTYRSEAGNTAVITVTDTVSVVAAQMLEPIFGKVYPDMVKAETKYSLKAPAKRILSAVWHQEYCRSSVAEIISGLHCDDTAKKALMKKIKGTDFDKDKENLMNFAQLPEEDASDLAYLIDEAAAWENICAFIKVNHNGEISEEILSDVITKINASVNVARGMKTELIAAVPKSEVLS